MKNYLLLFFAVCFSATLIAQPPEFELTTDCSVNFGYLYAQISVDGNLVPNGTWVAAVDVEGNIAGVIQSRTLSGFQGLVILPVYENSDVPSASCENKDGGINCETGLCEEFGVITYIPDPANPGSFCFASTISFIPYVKVAGPGGQDEIDGFTSANIVNGSAPVIAISSSNCVTDFDDAFTLLPVELTSFTGRRSGKTVELDWQTATEDGNEGFAIERSADGSSFTEIGYVTGAGTSRESVDYTFTDEQPQEGTNYYRLRQNDFTGGFSYSEVILVDFVGGITTSMQIAPNPVTDMMQVQLAGEWNEDLKVQLIDQNGKQVAVWNRQQTSFRLDLGTLPAGIYQLWVQDGEHQQTQRVVVK